MEKLLWQVDGVEYVYSMSRPDMAVVSARFYIGEDRIDSLVKLHNKIATHIDISPSGVAGWVIKPIQVDDAPIVNLALTMIMSLLVAFTVTPWMTYHILKGEYGKEEKEFVSAESRNFLIYRRLLSPLLQSRARAWLLVGTVVVLLAISVAMPALNMVPLKMLRLRDDLTAIAARHGGNLKIIEAPPGPPVISTLAVEVYAEPGVSYADQIAASPSVRR